MKVFISYSYNDSHFANIISNALKNSGYQVWFDKLEFTFGDNIINKIQSGIANSDAFIVIFSENALQSKWLMREISIITLENIINNKLLLAVTTDKSPIPLSLAKYRFIDLSEDINKGLSTILKILDTRNSNEINIEGTEKISNENSIKILSDALNSGRLTLLCGAGVSNSAGYPTWDKLIENLLIVAIQTFSHNNSQKYENLNIDDFLTIYGKNPLIVAKYLKIMLGQDFNEKLRDVLYSSTRVQSLLIPKIVDLARPQRDKSSLDSIITFNFDDSIEEELRNNHIRFNTIHSEGETNQPSEIAIYHVHGFLPRSGKLDNNYEVVFSEDTYHNQFLDPFSWSNLIQLNKFNQNTCLLVGLSLTDPNLRRLLDIAKRKSPLKPVKHYIIKRKPESMASKQVDDFALTLENQDAIELGLNVIWVDEYSEIPSILEKINLI